MAGISDKTSSVKKGADPVGAALQPPQLILNEE